MNDDYVVNSYRYLRLALVVVTVTLGISLALEIIAAGCLQGSISAYYYTSVHSIFIGVLFVIGVALVALIGRDGVEDLFFNLAGFLAPVVALVPTARPSDLCGPTERHLELSSATTRLLVTNNTWSLLLGFLLAFLVALWLANRGGNRVERLRKVTRANWVGLTLSFLVLAGGFIWFLNWRTSFDERAHGTAAVLMFVAIWLAVLVNADFEKLRPVVRLPYDLLKVPKPSFPADSKRKTVYEPWYKRIAIFMAVAGVVGGLAVRSGVSNAVFWLEAAEIVPFACFWALQTAEGWTSGTTAPEATPTEAAPAT